MPNWFRWVLVLPAAFLAAVLSAFPLHWVLYTTLTSGILSFETYPETPERVLLPFVAAIAFVWVGSKVAPRLTFKAAIFLFTLWVLLSVTVIIWVSSGAGLGGSQVNLEGGGLAPIMGIIGAIVGLYIVRVQNVSANQ